MLKPPMQDCAVLLVVAVTGALLGSPQIVGVGALGQLAAVGFVLWPHLDEVRRKHPADFATLSVLCAELLAARLHAEPLPLDAKLAQQLGSERLG